MSDFFILLTKAECAGIVFAESFSYGLPVITSNTGGIDSFVKNGINGYMFNPDTSVYDYAKIISEIYSDVKRYNDMKNNARNTFEQITNWDSRAQSFNQILYDIFPQFHQKIEKNFRN
jgi:glycosyltransferase involved in cell wall biosynthesis